jgi:cell wall-associated NlpC family hydrolase
MLVIALLASTLLANPAAARSRARSISVGADIAAHQMGDPYRYGSSGPNAFDCSGLVYYAFRHAGFRHVPRTSSAQAAHMRRIRARDLRRGDFVFFYSGRASARNVYHVGIFAGWHHGRRTIIHAPYSGARVRREPIWTGHWFAGTLRGL